MQRVKPALRVADFETSRRFYESLGFEVDWTHEFELGLPIFASLRQDGMEIFLTEHAGDCAFGGLVHFYIPDVDRYHSRLKELGVQISQPPANSLGPAVRDMLVLDPDGNRLIFLTISETQGQSE